MPPRIHLGINTCFAVKRWPEPEQWTRIVREELGLDNCQFSLDLVESLDGEAAAAYADTARECAAHSGLRIHSTFTGLSAYSWSQLLHPMPAMRAAAVRWFEQAIDFTSRLGAAGTGGHLGALSVQDASDRSRREARLTGMMEDLRHLSAYAAKAQLDFLLFENMAVPREPGHSLEEAHALADLTWPGGVPLILCLDIGHPCALRTGTTSDDYRAWLEQPWTRTPVIHLQQTDYSGDHHWPFTERYNREGVIQASSVLEILERWPDNATAYLFLEPIHPFETGDTVVLDELRESVRYWREALQRHTSSPS